MYKKVYKVPQQSDSYVTGNGFYSYLGSVLEVHVIECSNKLVLLRSGFNTSIYVDLYNGSIVSGYRPGGDTFLLGNIIEFYSQRNYDLQLSNMVYWIESYCFGETAFYQLGSRMAENSTSPSILATILLRDNNEVGKEFIRYVDDCLTFNEILHDTFIGRRSRQAEFDMLSKTEDLSGKLDKGIRMYSYLRARNKDFTLLYCREDDSYYVTLANRFSVGSFSNKDDIVISLRGIRSTSNSDMKRVMMNHDVSAVAEFHDFLLDLEKMDQVLKKIL